MAQTAKVRMIDETGSTDLPEVSVGGVALQAVTRQAAIHHLISSSRHRRGGLVVTPNVDHLRMLRHDERLRRAYGDANLVLADGMPLVWASRIQGTPLPERVAGSELIEPLAAAAAASDLPVAIMGGQAGTADRVSALLRERHPALRVVHTSCPMVSLTDIAGQAARLAAELHAAEPAIVFIGLGAPKQELFCAALRQHLPAAWLLGVGAGLDMVAGHVRKAPPWIARAGMEWLYRLAQEPSRLAKRYLVHGLPALVRLLAASVRVRMDAPVPAVPGPVNPRPRRP